MSGTDTPTTDEALLLAGAIALWPEEGARLCTQEMRRCIVATLARLTAAEQQRDRAVPLAEVALAWGDSDESERVRADCDLALAIFEYRAYYDAEEGR